LRLRVVVFRLSNTSIHDEGRRGALQAADKAPRPRLSGASFFYNSGMLKPVAATAQTELEMVTLGQLVRRDHLLRLIDAHLRFDFIRQKTDGLYCTNNGRPAIDTVVLFTGYLFGV